MDRCRAPVPAGADGPGSQPGSQCEAPPGISQPCRDFELTHLAAAGRWSTTPSQRPGFPDTEEATGSIPVPPTKFYQVSRPAWPSAITRRLRSTDHFSSWKRSPVRPQVSARRPTRQNAPSARPPRGLPAVITARKGAWYSPGLYRRPPDRHRPRSCAAAAVVSPTDRAVQPEAILWLTNYRASRSQHKNMRYIKAQHRGRALWIISDRPEKLNTCIRRT